MPNTINDDFDYKTRLRNAELQLSSLLREAQRKGDPVEIARLQGKRSGVNLAIEYLRYYNKVA